MPSALLRGSNFYNFGNTTSRYSLAINFYEYTSQNTSITVEENKEEGGNMNILYMVWIERSRPCIFHRSFSLRPILRFVLEIQSWKVLWLAAIFCFCSSLHSISPKNSILYYRQSTFIKTLEWYLYAREGINWTLISDEKVVSIIFPGC